MLELESTLIKKLKERHIQIDVTENDTVIFRNVPASREFFNKPSTNLLIKRCPELGRAFLVCVDEDLEYRGMNPHLCRTFARGGRHKGWKTLYFTMPRQDDFPTVVDNALKALGFDGQEPTTVLPNQERIDGNESFLSIFGTDLSQQVLLGQVYPTIAREAQVEQVILALRRWDQPRLALIVGGSGVGKTHLLRAVAGRLLLSRPDLNLVSIDLTEIFAGAAYETERENLLVRFLDDVSECANTIIALEHIELVWTVSHGALLLARFLDKGQCLMGTVLPAFLMGMTGDPMSRRMQVVKLDELTSAQTLKVLSSLRPLIAEHHHVEIVDSCLALCVKLSERLEGHLPAKAITLLDTAAAQAASAGAALVASDDIYFAARIFTPAP